MDPKIFFWVEHAKCQKTRQEQNFHACVVCATEPRVGGARAKISVFLKYLNLNSKFSILDNFPNDVSIYSRQPRKNQSKSSRQKKIAEVRGRGGVHISGHLVVNDSTNVHPCTRRGKIRKQYHSVALALGVRSACTSLKQWTTIFGSIKTAHISSAFWGRPADTQPETNKRTATDWHRSTRASAMQQRTKNQKEGKQ